MATEGRSGQPRLKDGYTTLIMSSLPGEEDWQIDSFETRPEPSNHARQTMVIGEALVAIRREHPTRRYSSPDEAVAFFERELAARGVRLA